MSGLRVAMLVLGAGVLGGCNRSAETDPGNQTTSASTGTAGARGTSSGQTNPTVPLGTSGAADRTGATAPTGTAGIIGSSGGTARPAGAAPTIETGAGPGVRQPSSAAASARTSQQSTTGAPGTAGTFGLSANGLPASGAGQRAGGESGASAPAAASTSITAADRAFLVEAAAGGLFEVQASQLAVTRAASSEVKALATMLVHQHANAGNELAQLAAVRGVPLPEQLPKDMQLQLRRLSQGLSTQFDRDYLQATVKAQESDLALFRKASGRVEDAQLKSWIGRMLPVLQQHLDSAQELAKKG